ncbi:MAG: hypothetical protein QOE99_3257, partial [Actinomycetota bacterium]|nr:hypothetical protein [Actinomycetota bacterium]
MRRLPLALAAAIAVAAVVAATAPPASAAPGDVTAVTYDSSNNAYYAPSSSQLADASRGQQVVVKRWTGKGVEIDTPAQYELVPGGADLAVGEYDVGTGPGQVRFVKYNEDCDNQTGHLSIRDFAATADAVQRLDATLQVNCTYNRITSEIRWHVDNPYRSARTTGQFRLPDGALGQDRSEALTLYATGMLPVTFGTPRFEGADAAAFSYSDDTCDGRTVPVGGSCTIVLHARPTHDQVSRTRLTIPDDTVHGARVLGVEAWVVPPPAAPSITVSAGYDGLGIRANASNMSASGQTTSFRFYRVTPTGDQGIGEAPAGKDGSGFVTDPLPPGASGTYRAVAVGPGGESGSSPNASGTVPVRAVPAAGDQTVSIVDRRLGVDIKTDTTVTAVPGAIRFMTGTSGDVTIAWTGDLAPGTYTTTTYPPGSSASSGNATAAVRITQPFCYGRQDLTVHESAVHANGTPDVLAATFHFACDDGTVLAGELRWHANTPYKVSQANTLGLQIGHQPVNTTTKHSVVITNRGTASLTIGTPAISSDEETYSVSGTTCGGPMAPGASCTVDVAAHPKTYGDHMAYVVVPDDSAAGRRDVRLYLQATTVPATPYTWVAPVIDRVQLRWEPVLYDSGGEQVTGYEIWRGPVGGALTRLASVNVSTSVYDDRGVRQGETWQYAVRARNSVGLSAMDPKTGDVPDVEVLMASDRGPSRIGQPLAAAADEIPVSWQSPDGLSGPSGMLSASADGSRVAYSSRPPQSSEYRLVVAAGDGSNPRTITSGHWDLQPTFSPDGRTLAFLREDQSGHNPQLWTVPVGGGTARRVPMADAPTAPAQWVS